MPERKRGSTRPMSLEAAVAEMIIATENGRKANPVCSGE